MKPLKLITSIASGLCVFATCNVRAQQLVTNAVTFSVMTFNQGPTNEIGSGPVVTNFGPTHAVLVNGAALLDELGQAINGTNGFTSDARLVLITGNGATFAVIDSTNFYDLSNNGLGIMNVNPANIQITSGSVSTTGHEKETQSYPASITYNDTPGNGFAGTLRFTLRGLVRFTEIKTVPVGGIFTDSVKGKISSITGDGTRNGNPFMATGTITFSGSEKF